MKKLLYIIPLLFIGCSSPKEIIREIPIEVIKTEYKTQYVHDSIYRYDSTFIVVKGDTVFNNVYKTKYIQKIVYDTLITHDTIPQTVIVTEIVEKKVPQWWPVWLTGGLLMLVLGAYLAIKYKLFDKLHI